MPGRSRCSVVVGCVLVLASPLFAQQEQPVDEEPVFFAEDWEFDWGADATFTLSDLELPSTNQVNDGSTEFDDLRLRLDGRLEWQDRAELVVDLFTSNAADPTVYGLYARVEPASWLGFNVGKMPLVVGAWQERASADRNPLVGAPLYAQYLPAIRSESVPADVEELLSQSGKGRDARFSLGSGEAGRTLGIYYEHCWDVGVEAYGRAAGFEWRLASMNGTPGGAENTNANDGRSLEARLSWEIPGRFRVGASFSNGPYLDEALEETIPADRSVEDFDQALVGADSFLSLGPVDLHAEWVRSSWESPFIADQLEVDGYGVELTVNLPRQLAVSARLSALDFAEITNGIGVGIDWEADVERFEAGVSWHFWQDHVFLKAVWQRTEVALEPTDVEEVVALQLGLHK